MQPYIYQAEALGAIRQVRQSGLRKALVIMASGLGKTATAAFDLKQWLDEHPDSRILYLCHQNEILAQSQRTCSSIIGEGFNRYGFYHGHEKNRRAQMLFGSFQTIRDRLKRFSPYEFDYIAVDESHHSMATTYRPIVEYFQPKFLLGMTATPNRMDLLDIREIFGQEIVNIPLEEAMAKGWLPPVEYHLVSDLNLDENVLRRITKEVLEEGKRLSLKELNRRIFIQARDEKVAEIVESYNEKTLIFCRNIHHAEYFGRFFKKAELYHSRQSRVKNQDTLENLRRGFTKRLLAVNAFNEGVDVPDVGLVVFLRITQSETIFWQQLGRGLRMRPEKSKLIVLDFVGNIRRIQMLKRVIEKVAQLRENLIKSTEHDPDRSVRERFHFSGKGFEFTFADSIVDILKVLEKIQTDKRAQKKIQYTVSDLLEQLKCLGKELGRTPVKRDIDRASKEGKCASYQTFLSVFGSLVDALRRAKFPVTTRQYQSYTDKELIQFLQRLARKLGRKPITSDIDKASRKGLCPDSTTFRRRFHGFRGALKAANLGTTNPHHFTKKELIAHLNRFYGEFGRVPTSTDLDRESKQRRYPNTTTFCHHFGTLSKALQAADLEPVRQHYTKKQMIQYLKVMARTLGRNPTITDIDKAAKKKKGPSSSTLKHRFGSINKALRAAKLKVNKEVKRYTDDELLEQLRVVNSKYGRPTDSLMNELSKLGKTAGVVIFYRRFGSLLKALHKAGL